MKRVVIVCALMLLVPATSAWAQLGQLAGRARKVVSAADQLKDLVITDQEERAMGTAISEKLRVKLPWKLSTR